MMTCWTNWELLHYQIIDISISYQSFLKCAYVQENVMSMYVKLHTPLLDSNTPIYVAALHTIRLLANLEHVHISNNVKTSNANKNQFSILCLGFF